MPLAWSPEKCCFFFVQRIVSDALAKKQVRQSRRTTDGKLKYDGPIIRNAGDAYMIDCNVTGTDEGTSDQPKFALLRLFMDHIFAKVHELVGPGGRFEGYLPMFQGDNAGPHTDAAFFQAMVEYCNAQGWHWIPQAPQMPHANNLDLAVFPSMSKRHSALLQQYSNTVAPVEEIHRAAADV